MLLPDIEVVRLTLINCWGGGVRLVSKLPHFTLL